MRTHSIATAFLIGSVLAGCSSGTDVENPEHVAAWANSASALAAFLPAYEPIAAADGEATIGDGTCPSVDDDATTLIVTGGCTTGPGRRFEGTATVVRTVSGYIVTFDEYGQADEGDSVPRLTGTVTVTRMAAEMHSFDADYLQDGLLTVDVDYQGTVAGTHDAATVWNGSGTITRGGFTDASGTATATTVDQRRDDVICGGEAASGRTELEINERTVVVTYDGATACDEAHTAQFSVDGEDQGPVEGITCAASPSRGGSFWVAALLAALMLVLARRRSSRQRARG